MYNIFKYIKKLTLAKTLPNGFILVDENNSIGYELSKIIAKWLLCFKHNKNSCSFFNLCKSCEIFTYNKHPDFYNINSSKKKIIKIDEIRNILKFLIYKPIISKIKVIIIYSINHMNEKAYNSLLKTLEEPPLNVLFLLISISKNITPTVRDRCLILNVKNKKTYNKKTISNLLNKFLLSYNREEYIYNEIKNINQVNIINSIYIILSNIIKKTANDDKKKKLFKILDFVILCKIFFLKKTNINIFYLMIYIKNLIK